MTIRELILKHFPDASDDYIDYIAWGRTGFPNFFPSDTTPEEHFEKQIVAYKEGIEKYPDTKLCDFCNEPAIEGNWLCEKHKKIMEKTSDER